MGNVVFAEKGHDIVKELLEQWKIDVIAAKMKILKMKV